MHSGPGRRGRFIVLAFLVLVLVLALAGGWNLRALPGAPPSGPDIVLVVWDTCRGDRVGVNGYPLPTTPRLAEVAAEGVTFRYCFAPSSWTPPSHASLFTGLIPSRHGLREKTGDRVRPRIRLLASTLWKAGYETVAAPANHLLGMTGLLEGFETVLTPTVGVDKDPGEAVAARVGEWVQARRGRPDPRRPLFLFVNLMDCHLPLSPSREDLAAVHGAEAAAAVPTDGAGVTPFFAHEHRLGLRRLEAERIRDLSLAYDGAVHAADRATGRILDTLRAEGIYGGALVCVAGDHGECLGEHGELEHQMSMGDPVLRVPLVVRWPGGLGGGRIEDAQVRLQDLHRTILEAAGASPPPGTGLDSLPLSGPVVAPRDAVAELQSMAFVIPSLRARFPGAPEGFLAPFRRSLLVFREAATGPSPRKFLRVTTDGEPGAAPTEREELFDLGADPGEDRDLLAPGGDPALAGEAPRLRRRAMEAIRQP